jgi:hypothetical protein
LKSHVRVGHYGLVTVPGPLTQYITSTFIAPLLFPNAIKHAVSTNAMTKAEAENIST